MAHPPQPHPFLPEGESDETEHTGGCHWLNSINASMNASPSTKGLPGFCWSLEQIFCINDAGVEGCSECAQPKFKGRLGNWKFRVHTIVLPPLPLSKQYLMPLLPGAFLFLPPNKRSNKMPGQGVYARAGGASKKSWFTLCLFPGLQRNYLAFPVYLFIHLKNWINTYFSKAWDPYIEIYDKHLFGTC